MMLSSVHLKAWLRTCGGPCVTAPQKLPGGTVSPEHLLGSAATSPAFETRSPARGSMEDHAFAGQVAKKL